MEGREFSGKERKMPDEYCPIIFTHQAMGQSEELVKCKGEKCAWFVKHENPKNEECAIKALADLVKYMTMRMKV